MAEGAETAVLESALLDQRMRADRHKANFESLKAQYLNLQDVSKYYAWRLIQDWDLAL